jgi:hypothetical protein
MTEERPTEPSVDDTQATPTPDAPPAPEQPAAEAAAAAAPAYTPPTYTPPAVPPPAAQPTVAWAPPPTTAVAVGQRTTASLAAGILLVILGIFGGLISLLVLTVGRDFARTFDFTSLPGFDAQGTDPGAIVGGVLAFFGIVLLVCSVFYIVGGVGIMRGRNWGRVIGIVIGILAGLFWIAGVAGGNQSQGGGAGFALVLLAIHVYVAIVLLFFWRTKSAA